MIENTSIVPLGDDLELVDAKAMLAQALVRGSAGLHFRTVEVIAFLQLYLSQEDAQALIAPALHFKAQQSPGYTRRIVEAIKALSVLDNTVRTRPLIGGDK